MRIIYLLFLLLIIFSCSEDKGDPGLGYEFYIKAELDGELVIYANESSPKSVNGAYVTHEGNPNGTTLHIQRRANNTSSSNYISIDINRIQLDDIVTPYNLQDPANPDPKPYFQIAVDDFDSDTYYGTTLLGNDINLSILGKENDIISGTFSGKLKTQSGQTMTVTNGEFRSRIDRIHIN